MKPKRPSNPELTDSLNELADTYGDPLLFNAFLELWDLEVIKAAVEQRTSEKEVKKRQNDIRFTKREIVLEADNHTCVFCNGESGSDFLEARHVGTPYVEFALDGYLTICRTCRNQNKFGDAKVIMEKRLKNSKYDELRKRFGEL